MTSNSSNRVYIGTINPGGSISQSGGSVRRPFTTPAAPGRTSFGSTNNALTVLSSHPTSTKATSSPQDEDMVMIEEELSSASPASSSTCSSNSTPRSSVKSESLSSVSLNTPVKGGPLRIHPDTATTASASPVTSTPDASAGRKARPVIESCKVKNSTKVSSPQGDAKAKGTSLKATAKTVKAKTGTEATSKAPNVAVRTPAPKLTSSTSDVKKRPATAGATMKPKCISLGRKELIGKGSFGMVYKALDLDTNRLLAVKEIPLDGPNLQQLPTVRREIMLMEKLSHPNIVHCFGHDIDDQYLRIYMEFVAGGCVSSLLKNFGSFQERQASIVTKQVLSGLQYLHERKIAHRDLKGDNILLQPDGTVKLADFGTARELATTAMSLAGTAYFMAPEMIKGTGHGLEADIWSVGCCIIEMLTGKPPFSHLVNQYAIMTHIAESQGPFDDAFPKDASPDVIRILKKCLVRDPSKRATCAELLKEDWILNPPTNAEMKGPVVLELNTISEVRERARKKDPSSSAGKSSVHAVASVKSVKGNGGNFSSKNAQPLSSFNPMVDDE